MAAPPQPYQQHLPPPHPQQQFHHHHHHNSNSGATQQPSPMDATTAAAGPQAQAPPPAPAAPAAAPPAPPAPPVSLRLAVREAVGRWFLDTLAEAQRGDPKQQALLAAMYDQGYGCSRNPRAAREWAERAAQRGYRMSGVYCTNP
jgi:TPR repeat protein